ncbi:MAG TPA: hypothetical protein VGR46_13010 [Candidatus Limnocylindria bacterium]|nr:hypothetical protein [Candidatus Limnocylindria bacterium]
MVGEEIAVVQHGGLSAGKELFKEPLHALRADVLTVPGLLASQILIIVLTITAAFAMRAHRLAASPRHI